MLADGSISSNHKSDPLSVIASQINEQHDRAIGHATSALEHARQAGELLQQAKQQIPHGEWLPWLAANCRVSARQAQRYLKVANNWQAITKNDVTSHLTIDDAIATAAPQADENGIDAWTAKIEALPVGRLLFGNFRHGFVVIFQSSQHVGYYHCYSYFISPEFEGGEAQETKRPMKAWGIANMMTSGGMKPDEFSETDQGRFQEHNIKGTLPYSQGFYRQLRGDQ